jgi:hypothetical protein
MHLQAACGTCMLPNPEKIPKPKLGAKKVDDDYHHHG